MPSKRTASKASKGTKKKSTKAKPASKRSGASRKRTAAAKASGPLVDVARKIGTTLGDLAVRTGLAGHDDDEPGEPGPTQQ